MNKFDLVGARFDQVGDFITRLGEKEYRAAQIFDWIRLKGATDFESMSNLPKSTRARLSAIARIEAPHVSRFDRADDGVEKYLLEMRDGATVEAVLIPSQRRVTLCVSSQVGCKIGCPFCRTGAARFERDLSAGEIVGQILSIGRHRRGRALDESATQRPIGNIVFMGMGEPLENYDNLLAALRSISDRRAPIVGARSITVSTSGLAPRIERLARDFAQVKLTVSLNAVDDHERDELVPINRRYNLARLFEALRAWPLPRGRRISFGYTLIKDRNDSDRDAEKLHRLTRAIPSKINLIPCNESFDESMRAPDKERIERFHDILKNRFHRFVTIRASRGADILAACGQLSSRPLHPKI